MLFNLYNSGIAEQDNVWSVIITLHSYLLVLQCYQDVLITLLGAKSKFLPQNKKFNLGILKAFCVQM